MASWRKPKRIGLTATIALGIFDIVVGLLNLPTIRHETDSMAWPPGGVLLFVLVLGAVMVVTAGAALATENGLSATLASVATILTALVVAPAFLTDASAGWRLFAGAVVVVATVSVWLTLSRPRRTDPA